MADATQPAYISAAFLIFLVNLPPKQYQKSKMTSWFQNSLNFCKSFRFVRNQIHRNCLPQHRQHYSSKEYFQCLPNGNSTLLKPNLSALFLAFSIISGGNLFPPLFQIRQFLHALRNSHFLLHFLNLLRNRLFNFGKFCWQTAA